MHKFAAFVSLYNPERDVVQRVVNYTNFFDKVYVYDNSKEISQIPKISNLEYMFNGNNEGLCYPINKVIDLCIKEKLDFLCTLDQDSSFESDDISIMKQFIIENEIEDVAIYAPQIIYNQGKNISKGIEFVDFAICSGSFLNIKILKKEAIRYDEYYFLDRFEKDFCTTIKKHSYRILRVNDSKLFQSLGFLNNGYTNHTTIRHYYIFRNRFYYNKKFHGRISAIIISFIQTLKHLVYISMHETNKLEKIKILSKAYYDFRQNNGERMK